MKQLFKHEIKYGLYSKIYLYIVFFLVFLFGIVSFVNYAAVITTYEDFLLTENYYLENDLDMESALKGEFDVQEDGNVHLVENPLLYSKEMVGIYIYSLSPKYALTQFLESAFLYFPIVFGTLGLLIAIYDFRYKTIKLKTVRENKLKFGLVKQASLMVSGLFILIVALLISFMINYLFYLKMSGIVPTAEFPPNLIDEQMTSSLLIKFVFAYIISIIFMTIGYTFGVIFKNMYIGFITIVVYTLILPGGLAVLDLKNSLHYIGNRIFEFYGVLDIDHAKTGTTLLSSIIVLLCAIFLPFLLNILIMKKRSSFET